MRETERNGYRSCHHSLGALFLNQCSVLTLQRSRTRCCRHCTSALLGRASALAQRKRQQSAKGAATLHHAAATLHSVTTQLKHTTRARTHKYSATSNLAHTPPSTRCRKLAIAFVRVWLLCRLNFVRSSSTSFDSGQRLLPALQLATLITHSLICSHVELIEQ